MERAFNMVTDGVRIGDRNGVFSDAFRHADDVRFLIANLAQTRDLVTGDARLALHLAGNDQHGNRISPGAENTI
jgi:hypothetical protein